MKTNKPMHSRAFFHRMMPAGPRHASGVGLIEVLVAVAILAFGMLGVAALQATALRNSQSALERSQAVTLTYSMLDRMRANIDQARIGNYNIPKTCNPPSGGTLITDDQRDWVNGLHGALGDSITTCGTITCGPPVHVDPRICTITVEWDDSRGSKGSSAQTIPTVTGL